MQQNGAEPGPTPNPSGVAARSVQSSSFLTRPEIHAAWEDTYLSPALDPIYDAIFARIHAALTGHPEPRLLDAGCGSCRHALRLARRGVRVTGVDFSPAALAAAAQTLAADPDGHRITLREGSLLALPVDDGGADNVLCWGVLMHIPDIETALSELCRVTAPGGRLVIGENSAASFDCRVIEPALRLAKRLTGRRLPERRRTAFGIEEWTTTDSGGLMVRKTDLDRLAAFCATRGLRLVDRFGGQFTELYAHARMPWLVRRIQRSNERRFARQGSVAAFHGQVLVFERPA